jgi:hypothetical protein
MPLTAAAPWALALAGLLAAACGAAGLGLLLHYWRCAAVSTLQLRAAADGSAAAALLWAAAAADPADPSLGALWLAAAVAEALAAALATGQVLHVAVQRWRLAGRAWLGAPGLTVLLGVAGLATVLVLQVWRSGAGECVVTAETAARAAWLPAAQLTLGAAVAGATSPHANAGLPALVAAAGLGLQAVAAAAAADGAAVLLVAAARPLGLLTTACLYAHCVRATLPAAEPVEVAGVVTALHCD